MVSIHGFTPRAQVEDFIRKTQKYRGNILRQVQFALNGVAMDAQKLSEPMVEKELDRPVPWMKRAFVAKKGKLVDFRREVTQVFH